MKTKPVLAVLSTLLVMGVAFTIPTNRTVAAPLNVVQSDKDGGECTGNETAGRCADKCPPPSFQRGIDKNTGAAICATVTGCPYGDSIPLGAECDKHAPESATERFIGK